MAELELPLLRGYQSFDDFLNSSSGNKWNRREVKIGIDAGRGLCRFAAAMPQRLFVGIEVKPEMCEAAAALVIREEVSNAVVVHSEAGEFLRSCTRDALFDAIHINFPTPFPTALSPVTRLVTETFAEDAFRVIKPSGVIRFVTDVEEYFIDASKCFSESSFPPRRYAGGRRNAGLGLRAGRRGGAAASPAPSASGLAGIPLA